MRVKISKNHLKELIRQSIRELKFKNQAAFDAYSKKHKMRKSTKVDIGGKETTAGAASKKGGGDEFDVGGPAHPNVPKGAKSSKDIGKPPQPSDFDGDMDKYLDALNQHMKDVEAKVDKDDDSTKAAKQANKKMEIDVLNKDADKGNGAQIDTENGTVTWTSGDPDEDTFFATNEDGEEIEVDYNDIVRFHNDNDSIMKNLRKESIKRRFTVKEVRTWMKKLEENRYKKVYNSDARRVSWMVNHVGESVENMPKSMRKKWTKAAYGRERYLAKEFLKSKKQQMSEQKLRGLIRKVIKERFKIKRG